MKKLAGKLTSVLGIGLFFAQKAWAQGTLYPSNPGGLPEWGTAGVGGMLATIIMILLGFAGTVALIFIIIGGFQYIFSGASEDLAKKGKSTVVNAVIGLIIILLSYTIITVVVKTLITGAP